MSRGGLNALKDELDKLAHEIALSAVRADIEGFCKQSFIFDGRWFDLTSADDDIEAWIVRNAVRYAELKGLLERHPQNAQLVRLKGGI